MAFSYTQKKRARRLAASFLKEIGTPARMAGFTVLQEAIAVVAEYPDRIRPLDGLLKSVAETLHQGYVYNRFFDRCDDTIAKAMKRCKPEKAEEYFGATILPEKGAPTVSDFIAEAAGVIRSRTIKMRKEDE